MIPTTEDRPALPQALVREFVRQRYGLAGAISPLPAFTDQNFLLDCGGTSRYVVKIASRDEDPAALDLQNAALEILARDWSAASSPRVIRSTGGESICTISDDGGRTYAARVLAYLPGTQMAAVAERSESTLEQIGLALGELDLCLLGFEHPAMDREHRWDPRQAQWLTGATQHIPDPGQRGIVERLLVQYRGRVVPIVDDLPLSVIHNDANEENLLLDRDGEGDWRMTGLLDFGDMLRTYTVNELAVACAYAILGRDDHLAVAASITAGYHRARPLSDSEIKALFPLICLRLCVSVTRSAMAAKEDPQNEHRRISEQAAWEMLARLEELDWLVVEARLRQVCGLEPRFRERPATSTVQLLEERRKLLGSGLTLAYETPLEIVRGRGQYLFTPDGRAWLDGVNNICHVGHSHPRVVAALSRQAARLNSNTRYLHPLRVEYARRLTATFPDPLKVCYFVNSGSEANELAVRLARAYTERWDVIVMEDGYHGNTGMLVNMSPYKCEGRGGQGLPEWAHKVPKPDPYRGLYQGYGKESGRAYAAHVREICEHLAAEGRPPALFMCESIQGCGGQVVFPEGYLLEAFHHVRAGGGICIVDEIQVGLGRVGSHMWAFETQGVIPDIVTLGKPLGNGHPLGAVVTTREIARAFDDGMEFFSSFGGNPVSMAVGLAVLDVIEAEGLQAHAARVGDYLAWGFRDLGKRCRLIGDVRGLGLFLGVELVRDRDTMEPATGATSRLIELVKADGILLSAEGPHHNVLKIKPPLPFSRNDADLMLGAVERALATDLR